MYPRLDQQEQQYDQYVGDKQTTNQKQSFGDDDLKNNGNEHLYPTLQSNSNTMVDPSQYRTAHLIPIQQPQQQYQNYHQNNQFSGHNSQQFANNSSQQGLMGFPSSSSSNQSSYQPYQYQSSPPSYYHQNQNSQNNYYDYSNYSKPNTQTQSQPHQTQPHQTTSYSQNVNVNNNNHNAQQKQAIINQQQQQLKGFQTKEIPRDNPFPSLQSNSNQSKSTNPIEQKQEEKQPQKQEEEEEGKEEEGEGEEEEEEQEEEEEEGKLKGMEEKDARDMTRLLKRLIRNTQRLEESMQHKNKHGAIRNAADCERQIKIARSKFPDDSMSKEVVSKSEKILAEFNGPFQEVIKQMEVEKAKEMQQLKANLRAFTGEISQTTRDATNSLDNQLKSAQSQSQELVRQQKQQQQRQQQQNQNQNQ